MRRRYRELHEEVIFEKQCEALAAILSSFVVVVLPKRLQYSAKSRIAAGREDKLQRRDQEPIPKHARLSRPPGK